MSLPGPVERYHALDSLRAFAMFLGVLLHAAIAFMVKVPSFWPVKDSRPDPLHDLALLAIHDFRMQLFFLLAGFFACLLYQRYGLGGLLLHRLRRVAVPFALALLLITPTVQAVAVYAEVYNARGGQARGEPSPLRPYVEELIARDPSGSAAQITADFFTSGAWLARLPLLHLWFLYYLLIFVVVVAVLAPVFGRLGGTRPVAALDAAFKWVIESRWRVLAPAALTFPLLLPMTWVVDTPTRWNPQWHIVGYYGFFFAFGWALYRHRDLVPAFGRWWGAQLVVANVVVLPLALGAVMGGAEAEQSGGDRLPFRLAGFAAQALYTWLMITGLWGAFLRLFARESAWARYLADSAYWCYLASLTPLVALQFLVRDWPLPGPLKCLFVVAVTGLVLLASYEWCVRYTWIGAVLNGRKTRPRRAPEPPAHDGASPGGGPGGTTCSPSTL